MNHRRKTDRYSHHDQCLRLFWIRAIIYAVVILCGYLLYLQTSEGSVYPYGATYQCQSGAYSLSSGRGTCSHNGGIMRRVDQ